MQTQWQKLHRFRSLIQGLILRSSILLVWLKFGVEVGVSLLLAAFSLQVTLLLTASSIRVSAYCFRCFVFTVILSLLGLLSTGIILYVCLRFRVSSNCSLSDQPRSRTPDASNRRQLVVVSCWLHWCYLLW